MLARNKLIYVLLSFLMVFSLTFSLTQYTPASAQGKDGVRREHNTETGKVNFIGSQSGLPLKASVALGIPATERPQNPGKALAHKYGTEFGLKNPDKELKETKSKSLGNGRLNVRYQQIYNDIPILAGGLIVNTNENGDLYSITGEVASDLSLSTDPTVSQEDAQSQALQLITKIYAATSDDFVVSSPELWIYDESLLVPSHQPASLVWRMEVTPVNDAQPIRELVLVDAQTGKVALHFNQIDTGWTESVHSTSHSNTSSFSAQAYPPPTPFGATRSTYTAHNNTNEADDTLLCSNKDLTCTGGTDTDADSAHLFAGLVWAFYNEKHGRNSIDDGVAPGMDIISHVHYDSGYANAFWDGSSMNYGDGYGFANADDVIAHELTHGVTQYESGLLYFYQAGAINESFSDVWGEYFDQTNNEGNDDPSVKWLMGEDITDLGAIRSMSNPPAFGNPDKMTSPLFYKGEDDNGGVHTNSGVNNKAAFLMVDGAVFNGKTVVGIGWDKTAAIYYEVQTNLLGSGSNYSDLYYDLQQACSNLIGGPQGITLDDCINVKNALDAVQMNASIPVKDQITAPLCPTGQVASAPVFEDQMEGLISDHWNQSTPRWYLLTDIASSPTHSLYGDDNGVYLDVNAAMNAGVVIPPNAYLHFDHAYDFEYSGSSFYDGAVLEYSTNGGANWNDAGLLFSAGANYGGTISPYFGNALGGRKGFVGSTFSYYSAYYNWPDFEVPSLVSSRYNLNPLAGQTVRFRFRFATDLSFEFGGWYIDNVQIYTCVGIPSVPTLLSPVNGFLTTDYTPKLDWADSTPALDRYQLQVATDNAFTNLVYDVTDLGVSEYTVPADLDENSTFYWRVRAFNSEDATNNWSAVRNFRTVLLPPILVSPANLSSPMTPRPTFTWTNPNGGPAPTSYTIQISSNITFSTIAHTGTATTTSYTPAVNLPGGQLYWRVQANGANGPSAYSSPTISFFTPLTAPPAPTQIAPAANFLTTDYTPTFTWSAGTLPNGTTVNHFQIQVDNNSNFSSPEVDDSTPVSPTFTPGSDLASNTTFYWHVRTFNNFSESGPWSTVRTVRTALLPPTLSSPADGVNVLELRPTFDWTDVAGATGYTIQISKNDTFTMIVNTGSPVGSQYTPSVDLPKNTGTPLYWRVQTKGTNGPSSYSASRSFTTPTNPPLPPTLLLPASNALTTDYTPTFSWSMSATSPSYHHFFIQVDNNADFSSPEINVNDSSITTLNYTPGSDLASNTKFYWRVRAVNISNEMGNWSAVRYFRTALLPPTLSSPANGATVLELRPTFDWTDVAGATGYTIQIAKDAGFTQVVNTGNPLGSSYAPSVDLPKNTGTPLFWRVQTKGTNGPSVFTTSRSFNTPVNPPLPPTLVSPPANYLTVVYTPGFFWTMPATSPSYHHFFIQIDNDADFSSPVINVNDSSITTTNYTPGSNLASNTKFYWRVRAVNLAGEMSNWSAVRYFRTALDVPVLQSPTNGSSMSFGNFWPVFNWADVPGAAGYTIQISTNPSFTVIVSNANIVQSAYEPLSGYCGSGVTFYWHVRATGTNPGTWSATFSFTLSPCP